MRLHFRDVGFAINNLPDAYAIADTLPLVFCKRQAWMRKPLSSFYPTVYLIGVPDAREAALTLSVISGAAARLRQARRRGKELTFIGWFFIAGGWLLFFGRSCRFQLLVRSPFSSGSGFAPGQRGGCIFEF